MPTPKRRPSKAEIQRRAQLDELLARDAKVPPPDLTIRTDSKVPSAKQLAEFIDDPAQRKLVAALKKQGPELVAKLTTDPEFGAALARDPEQALAGAGIPKELAKLVQAGALKDLLDRIHGVVIEQPAPTLNPGVGLPAPTPDQMPGLQLLAASLAAGRADAAVEAQLQTQPRPAVADVAAAAPPTGATDPVLLAGLVDQVASAFEQVHATAAGSTTPMAADLGDRAVRTIRIRPGRGL